MADQRYSNFHHSCSDSDSDNLPIDEDFLERMKPPPYEFGESMEILYPAKVEENYDMNTTRSKMIKGKVTSLNDSAKKNPCVQDKNVQQINDNQKHNNSANKDNMKSGTLSVKKRNIGKQTHNQKHEISGNKGSMQNSSATGQKKNAQQQTDNKEKHKFTQVGIENKESMKINSLTVQKKNAQQQTDNKQKHKFTQVGTDNKESMKSNSLTVQKIHAQQQTGNKQKHKYTQVDTDNKDEIQCRALTVQNINAQAGNEQNHKSSTYIIKNMKNKKHKYTQPTGTTNKLTNSLSDQTIKLKNKYGMILNNEGKLEKTSYLDNEIKLEIISVKFNLCTFSHNQWSILGNILHKIHNAQSCVGKKSQVDLGNDQDKPSTDYSTSSEKINNFFFNEIPKIKTSINSLQKTTEQDLNKTKELRNKQFELSTISNALQKVNRIPNEVAKSINSSPSPDINRHILNTTTKQINEIQIQNSTRSAPLQKIYEVIPKEAKKFEFQSNLDKYSLNNTKETAFMSSEVLPIINNKSHNQTEELNRKPPTEISPASVFLLERNQSLNETTEELGDEHIETANFISLQKIIDAIPNQTISKNETLNKLNEELNSTQIQDFTTSTPLPKINPGIPACLTRDISQIVAELENTRDKDFTAFPLTRDSNISSENKEIFECKHISLCSLF